jgi:hypothetical protein
VWKFGSSAEDIIRRLKGNTGICIKHYSGAVPATVSHFLLLATIATVFVTEDGKAPAMWKARRPAVKIQQYQSFRVKGDVRAGGPAFSHLLLPGLIVFNN